MSSVPGSVLKDKESFGQAVLVWPIPHAIPGIHTWDSNAQHTRCQLLSALCQIDPKWATWGRQDLFGLKVSRVISVYSPWFSPFGANSEGKFRGRGRGSMWQRLLTLWQAGSREKKYRTGQGRIQSSTNILPCYPLLPPSPCPQFFTESQLHRHIGSPSGVYALPRTQLSGYNHLPEDHEQCPSSRCMSL